MAGRADFTPSIGFHECDPETGAHMPCGGIVEIEPHVCVSHNGMAPECHAAWARVRELGVRDA